MPALPDNPITRVRRALFALGYELPGSRLQTFALAIYHSQAAGEADADATLAAIRAIDGGTAALLEEEPDLRAKLNQSDGDPATAEQLLGQLGEALRGTWPTGKAQER